MDRRLFAVLMMATVLGVAAGDVCRRLCGDSSRGPSDQYSRSQCERGCRLFNIGMNTNWSADKSLDLNLTKDQCYQSCSEAYVENTQIHCFTGCSEMLNFQKETWLYFEQRGENDGVIEVEVSLVSDPVLWEQTLESNGAYKIPQTFIRTMPLRPELGDTIDAKNWNPCIPPNNEIPRWIVAAIAIALTVFTLYVSFILPSRQDLHQGEDAEYEENHSQDGEETDSDDTHKEGDYDCDHGEECKKAMGNGIVIDLNLLSINDVITKDYHVNVVPPPKYTLLPVTDKPEA